MFSNNKSNFTQIFVNSSKVLVTNISCPFTITTTAHSVISI